MWLTKINRSKGFTLLEMLIAMAIFALLGVAANAVLQTVLKNDEVTKDFSLRLKGLQQGFGAIQRDLTQVVARTPRALEGGRGSNVIQFGNNLFQSQSEAIVFYRLGWLNPDGMLPRGSLQSVAYVVQDEKLERWFFPYPEPEFGSEPQKTVLMERVLSVKYSFYHQDKWQQKMDGTTLPSAIAMEIEIDGLGVITRKFLVAPASAVNADNSGNNSGTNSGGSNNGKNSGNNSGNKGNSGGGSGNET